MRSALAIVAVMGLALHAMGQPLWCAGGEPWIWSSEVWSWHNSQHLFDPYTLSHVSHGLLLAVALRALLPASRYRTRGFVIAVAFEAAWEVLENSDVVIRRYRETTMSLDYFGDSVANSIGDVLAMMAGYLAAARLHTREALAVFIVLEVGLALWIRDGVLLNVLMLVAPAEAVKAWQLGGAPR